MIRLAYISKYREQIAGEIRTARKIKTLRQYVEQEYLDEEGNAVIDIHLYEGLELFDPLSMGKQRDINPEIIDFIDRKSNLIPNNHPIILRFHGGTPSEEEKQQAADCLEEHYAVVLQDRAWDLRSNNMQLMILAIIGVAFVSLYLFCALKLEEGLFLEILSIIGSFALWEAADRFLIERSAIRKDMAGIAQNKIQTVEFCKDADAV